MQGQSLVPVFQGAAIEPRTLYWEHEGNRAIRDGDWKLVGRRNEPWELYDIARDRTELKDLSESRPAVSQKLKAKWRSWADQVGVLSPAEFEQQRQRVRENKRRAKKQKS